MAHARARSFLLLFFAIAATVHGWPLRRAQPSNARATLSLPPEPPLPPIVLEYFPFLSSNATRLERKDWGRQLALSLENFRVPAALVAGSALASAFTVSPLPSDALVVGLCKRLHLILSIGSFTASIITVALATSALVQLNDRDSGRDSTAANLEDYVSRAGYSVELWVAVNANFIMGLLALCCAVGTRCWILYADGDPFARVGACMVGAGTCLALGLGLPGGNHSLVALLQRYASAVGKKALNVREPAPLLASAMLLALASIYWALRETMAFVAISGSQLGSTAADTGG